MKRRNLLVLPAATVIAFIVVLAATATPGTIYTWEKTFEVKKPEIECEIEVGDHRVVGCPVKVWVCLKLEDCSWGEWKDQFDDDWDDACDDCPDCKDEWDEDWKDNNDRWKCGCCINGTYSVHLYWYNETSEDFQHVMHLQEEINITLTCFKHMETYTFIPEWKGEYKVVVTFAVDSETYNFTNED